MSEDRLTSMGSETTSHVSGLQSDAESNAEARNAHGERVVHTGGMDYVPAPNPEPPPNPYTTDDPFSEGSAAEEADESIAEERAEEQQYG